MQGEGLEVKSITGGEAMPDRTCRSLYKCRGSFTPLALETFLFPNFTIMQDEKAGMFLQPTNEKLIDLLLWRVAFEHFLLIFLACSAGSSVRSKVCLAIRDRDGIVHARAYTLP